MRTTIHCTIEEKELIDFNAKKNGLSTTMFINHRLEETLPVTKEFYEQYINEFVNLTGSRQTRIGADFPKDLEKKIIKNIENISSKYKKIKLCNLVLLIVLMGCEE